jgi:DNA-binding SARP family transcriptional activator
MGTVLACCLFTFASAIQVRLDLIPVSDRLTTSEYVTDKFRILKVRQRKLIIQKAEILLSHGSAPAAVAALEAAEDYGPDRDVLAELSKAYRASGRESEAQNADRRLTRLMASRWF